MRSILLGSTILLATGFGGAALAESQSGDAAFCAADYMPAPRGAEGVAGMANASEFAEMDTDGDGMVSQAEYIACRNAAAGTESVEADRTPENMTEADADADQELTREEYVAAAVQAHGAIAASSNPGLDPVEVMRRYIFVPTTEPEPDMAAMSGEEITARSEMQFDALDADQDDLIDMDEWKATVATIEDRTEALIEGFGDLDADSSGDLSEEEFGASTMPGTEAGSG